jgi:hypothetical protein
MLSWLHGSERAELEFEILSWSGSGYTFNFEFSSAPISVSSDVAFSLRVIFSRKGQLLRLHVQNVSKGVAGASAEDCLDNLLRNLLKIVPENSLLN